MNQDFRQYRKSYEQSELLETNISENPFELFSDWFDFVDHNTNQEVNAMTLSTIGLDGFPKSRVVLLKYFSSKGFVFFTNYNSEKGKAIAENPNVCISFFWENFEKQVIIKGKISKVSDKESDDYFKSRPLGSQMGAIVSQQSEVIPSREFLDEALDKISKQSNTNLQKPEHWGGYIVEPVEFEFWQGRANRLHDRIRYKKSINGSWQIDRLSP